MYERIYLFALIFLLLCDRIGFRGKHRIQRVFHVQFQPLADVLVPKGGPRIWNKVIGLFWFHSFHLVFKILTVGTSE